MSKIKYGVEGFEGVQRTSASHYTHAVVVTPDLVARAAWEGERARGEQAAENRAWVYARDLNTAASQPGDVLTMYAQPETAESIAVAQGFIARFPTVDEYHAAVIKAAEALLMAAKASVASEDTPGEAVSFHSSYALAVKAMNAAMKGVSWREASVAKVTIL